MEDTTQEATQQPTVEQPTPERPKLMPGQEHEDELDLLGGVFMNSIQRGFEWIKHFFAPK